jgi:hypothetical protein
MENYPTEGGIPVAGEGWVECKRGDAEEVAWRKNGSWIGWMPLNLCVWPYGADYIYRKRTYESP